MVGSSPSRGHPERGFDTKTHAGPAFTVGLRLPPVNTRVWVLRGSQSVLQQTDTTHVTA